MRNHWPPHFFAGLYLSQLDLGQKPFPKLPNPSHQTTLGFNKKACIFFKKWGCSACIQVFLNAVEKIYIWLICSNSSKQHLLNEPAQQTAEDSQAWWWGTVCSRSHFPASTASEGSTQSFWGEESHGGKITEQLAGSCGCRWNGRAWQSLMIFWWSHDPMIP